MTVFTPNSSSGRSPTEGAPARWIGETVLWAATRGAEGVYIRAPAEYVGASTRDFLHPDDLGRWETTIDHARSGAATGFTGRAMDGEGRWVHVRSYQWPTRSRHAVVSITLLVDED